MALGSLDILVFLIIFFFLLASSLGYRLERKVEGHMEE